MVRAPQGVFMAPNRHQITKALDYMDVFRLRRDGFSIEDIALKLRVPPVRVRAVLSQALNSVDSAAQGYLREVRAIEVARLDVATKAVMPKVSDGDLNAINTLLKVMARRANLLGLDAPREVISTNFNHDMGQAETDPTKLPTSELRRRLMEILDKGQVIDVTPTEPTDRPEPNQP
jgi:hypothetical protein